MGLLGISLSREKEAGKVIGPSVKFQQIRENGCPSPSPGSAGNESKQLPSLKSRGRCVQSHLFKRWKAEGELSRRTLLPGCRVGSLNHLTFSEVRM